MIIQIFGTKKCPETRKAERFFKDRTIDYQFRDLAEKPPSKGELDTLARLAGKEALIDTDGKAYKNGGWAWRDFDILETLQEDPSLYKTPIIRGADIALCGYDEKKLKQVLGR